MPDFINIIPEVNGLTIDCTLIPGRDFSQEAKKIFKPKDSIDEVRLYQGEVIVKANNGDDYTMVPQINMQDLSKYPVTHVNGVKVTDAEDLYTKFVVII